jgi:large subunit ribosomal protein L25
LNNIELQVTTRKTTGNGPARVLRSQGRVPAILYGPAAQPHMLSVSTRDMEDIIKEGKVGRSIFNLVIDDGKEPKAAMIKEVQAHPVDRNLLHIDFYEVDMARKVRVHVPVITTGKAIGVEMGGMLQIIRRELEVLCLPNAIPQAITVDVANLDVGQSVHVEDLKISTDIEIPHEVNFTILTILSQKKDEEVAAEGAEEAVVAEEGAAASEDA